MCLVLRYLKDDCVREDFIGFLDVQEEIIQQSDCDSENVSTEVSTDVSTMKEISAIGKALGEIVLNNLKALNVNLDDCVGITTDNCSVMTRCTVSSCNRST